MAEAEESPWYTLARGQGPVAAAAIHDGHGLRPEVAAAMALSGAERLREEDPFTGEAIGGVPSRAVAGRSRFEVDLNRAPAEAVYRAPGQSWGLRVWKEGPPPDDLVARSLAIHASFYAAMKQLMDELAAAHGRFVLLDVHSYNHRRDGPDAPPMPQEEAPDINIGTFSMPRERWAWLLDPLIEAIAGYDYGGRRLDVRENVSFQGKGELARFTHAHFPHSGCCIAFEFKKFYMDEWTGKPERRELELMRGLIDHVAASAAELLDGR
ncbi:MAG: N-formylglutamate amidohydrolase [Sphingomonadaceae bacterium]